MFPAPLPNGELFRGQPETHRESPYANRTLPCRQSAKATPGMSLGDGQVSQIDHGGGKVTVQCHFGNHLTLLGFR